MHLQRLQLQYRKIKEFLDWTDRDTLRLRALWGILEPSLGGIIDCFLRKIAESPATRGYLDEADPDQRQRLRNAVLGWFHQLLKGPHDESYLERRWTICRRHVEIGLEQPQVTGGMAYMRRELASAVHGAWTGTEEELLQSLQSLNKALDLEMAIFEDAYYQEYVNRLKTAERLMTLGRVAGGIAHELRNPLGSIRNAVYLLQKSPGAGPEFLADQLRSIQRQVELAQGVITALTDIVRLPSPSVQDVSIHRLVQDALEANPSAPGIKVVMELPPELPSVRVDPRQLRIVISNLVRNACEAMPQGGLVTIRASASSQSVRLSVEDRGSGIPANILSRITEPLYSTKSHGLGLGLAICQSILEKNSASLEIQTELGEGSIFTIQLPRSDPLDG